jgi:glutamate---cysteine ligase / carboxylate-amine ligase
VSPIDLAAAEGVFADSVDGTVGLEEEFAILDPETLALAPGFEDLRDSAEPALAEHLAGELIRSEVEIVSGKGDDLADAQAHQREARRRLFAHAATRGVALGSTGTHPFSDYREQQFIDTEHYRRVADSLQYVAKRNNTFSLHVHVGVNGVERAVRVSDRLRPLLPTLLAVSASSPYVDARDSGLHSARTQTFTKSFPRCGVPDAYGSWEAYRAYLQLLIDTGSIVEYTQVWWSVRPHLSFGTVEVRVCDAQVTAGEADALATLIAACVSATARDIDAGVPFEDPPGRLIEENMWRAIRHGMDGELIDLASGRVEPARAAVERLVAWSGADVVFPELNGAQRQRRQIEAGASMQEIYAQQVEETRATYAGETVRT